MAEEKEKQYVNGRRAILQCLDSLLAEEGNIRIYRDAFQARIDAEPMEFFKNIVMPLMPKDVGEADEEKNKDQTIRIEFAPAKPPEKKET